MNSRWILEFDNGYRELEYKGGKKQRFSEVRDDYKGRKIEIVKIGLLNKHDTVCWLGENSVSELQIYENVSGDIGRFVKTKIFARASYDKGIIEIWLDGDDFYIKYIDKE